MIAHIVRMGYTLGMRTNRPEAGAYDALRAEVRGSPEAREQHRIHAVMLVAGGLSCRAAARLLGDSPRAVGYWVTRYKVNKIDGLLSISPAGRPPRLSVAQKLELRAAVLAGPPFPGAVGWRGQDAAALIARRWGVKLGLRQAQRHLASVRSNPDHVRKII